MAKKDSAVIDAVAKLKSIRNKINSRASPEHCALVKQAYLDHIIGNATTINDRKMDAESFFNEVARIFQFTQDEMELFRKTAPYKETHIPYTLARAVFWGKAEGYKEDIDRLEDKLYLSAELKGEKITDW